MYMYYNWSVYYIKWKQIIPLKWFISIKKKVCLRTVRFVLLLPPINDVNIVNEVLRIREYGILLDALNSAKW